MTDLDIKRRASELLAKGRYDEAVEEYQALLGQSKKPNPAILNLIGDIYCKQENLEKGFDCYLRAARAYHVPLAATVAFLNEVRRRARTAEAREQLLRYAWLVTEPKGCPAYQVLLAETPWGAELIRRKLADGTFSDARRLFGEES